MYRNNSGNRQVYDSEQPYDDYGDQIGGYKFNPTSRQQQITVQRYNTPQSTRDIYYARTNRSERNTHSGSSDDQLITPTETPFVAADEGGELPIRRTRINYDDMPATGPTTIRRDESKLAYTRKQEQYWLDQQQSPKLTDPNYNINNVELPELIAELVNLMLEVYPYFLFEEKVGKTITPDNFRNYTLEEFMLNIVQFLPVYLAHDPDSYNDILSLANEILARYHETLGWLNGQYYQDYYNKFMKQFNYLTKKEREDLVEKYRLVY